MGHGVLFRAVEAKAGGGKTQHGDSSGHPGDERLAGRLHQGRFGRSCWKQVFIFAGAWGPHGKAPRRFSSSGVKQGSPRIAWRFAVGTIRQLHTDFSWRKGEGRAMARRRDWPGSTRFAEAAWAGGFLEQVPRYPDGQHRPANDVKKTPHTRARQSSAATARRLEARRPPSAFQARRGENIAEAEGASWCVSSSWQDMRPRKTRPSWLAKSAKKFRGPWPGKNVRGRTRGGEAETENC